MILGDRAFLRLLSVRLRTAGRLPLHACTLGWLQAEWDVWSASGSNSGDGGNLKVGFCTEVGALSNVSIGLLQVCKLVADHSEIKGW